MENFLNWITTSSANPQNVSMTIKGVLLANIGTIIYFLQVLHINWAQDKVASTIQLFSVIVGVAVFLAGLTRKMIIFLQKP